MELTFLLEDTDIELITIYVIINFDKCYIERSKRVKFLKNYKRD